MVRKIITLTLIFLGALLAQVDMSKEEGTQTITVSNSGWTPVACPLVKARWVQVLIPQQGSAQAFKLRNPLSQTEFSIPEGGSYEIFLSNPGCGPSQVLWEAQMVTSTTSLQILAQRELGQ